MTNSRKEEATREVAHPDPALHRHRPTSESYDAKIEGENDREKS